MSRAKKKAVAATESAAPDVIAERIEAAKILFPYVEPRWPGTPARWPNPVPLAELIESACSFFNTASSAANRGAPSHAPALCAGAARRVIEWLAATAASGDTAEARAAQAELFDIARQATGQLISGFHAGWPQAIARARKTADVPGIVSQNPVVAEHTKRLLRQIGQGEDVPALLKKPSAHKSPVVIDSPAHRLVACLHDYMSQWRGSGLKFFPDLKSHVAPRLREILELPSLFETPDALKQWESVSWKILKDWSPGGEPWKLLVRNPTLRPLVTDKRTPLREAHRKAWKALAR